ncbi:hypothetical protein [Agarilytica rhodophyticola]|uniref:hypothetical protein n=1 Tax=Agarilytica rhodophyticola TaxID=1737490 RepID=UPI000CD974D8|nr:hypothetical protein [Agarilytica rhodophyticola]
MKIKLLIITILLLTMHSAAAQIMQWRGSVTFANGSSTIPVGFSGPTYKDCEAQRSFTKSMYGPPFTIVNETACISFPYIDLDKLKYIKKPKIYVPPKIGPLCLSCPYLNHELFRSIYPNEAERFIKLMDQYRIEEYNKAFKELNSQYDMEGFSKDINILEREINRGIGQ